MIKLINNKVSSLTSLKLGGSQISVRNYNYGGWACFTPPPPPKEYNPDGTPKIYRLNQKTFKHPFQWERWEIKQVGMFHTVYMGRFGIDMGDYFAWLLSFPIWMSCIIMMCISCTISLTLLHLPIIGVLPKHLTEEWMIAVKERDRAENINPVSRYLDRRRAERGSHWIGQDFVPYTKYIFHANKHKPDADVLEYWEKMKAKNPHWHFEDTEQEYPVDFRSHWTKTKGC
eukprot:GHVL01033079.1.p1 GENE.GHVL01033079.1~~GHVL01033079.1.p1  ORF type:complete len:229 (+),score=30.53 GHVL01033079.1:25-711(+)